MSSQQAVKVTLQETPAPEPEFIQLTSNSYGQADGILSGTGPRGSFRTRACSRPPLGHLYTGIGQLVAASLSVNTRQAYVSAKANFTCSRRNYFLSRQWPVQKPKYIYT